MVKKIKSVLLSVLVASTLAAPIGVKADASAEYLLNEALQQKTFYSYNTAYNAIMNVQDANIRTQYLAELASITDQVLTSDVINFTKKLETLGKTKSGRLYDQIIFEVTNSKLSEIDKGYLLGELTNWGRKLVWTRDYVQAMEILNGAWSRKNIESLKACENTVWLVENQYSREYLLEEVDKLRSVVLDEVIVRNSKELIAALGSNRRLLLEPGTYNLSEVADEYIPNNNVTWEVVEDGKQLVITGVDNLIIEGSGSRPSEIVVEPRYAYIMKFGEGTNISLKNIKAGHTIIPDKYECNAGVLKFESSKNITINNSVLYGSGSEGISALDVKNLDVQNSTIEDCNLRSMSLNRTENATFENCRFKECKYQDTFTFYSCNNIVVNNSEISDNVITTDDPLIRLSKSTNIKFINSRFINNKANSLKNTDADIDFTGSVFLFNKFDVK